MAEKKTVRLITLGCSKNLVDSEKLASYFPATQYRLQFEHSNTYTHYLLLNTCGFISDAKEESVQAILEAVQLKQRGQAGKIIVWGCLSQRYRHELAEEIPEVDLWTGTESFQSIAEYITRCEADTHAPGRIVSTPSHYAYLKISEGCNRLCSFCAIPLIRGKFRSFPMAALLNEARALAAGGVKEIILIAQDLTYYGVDLNGKQQITKLVQSLSSIRGIEWIRLHYLYPQRFPEDLLYEIRDNPKVCKYIDIPFQHISDRILKQMRRGITTDETHRLIAKIRKIIPNITIRTTIMVGFPGETDKEFNELYDFVEQNRFDRLGVFGYSHEEATPAAKNYRDNVSQRTKSDRVNSLMELQRTVSLEKNEALVGKKIKVLIDRKEGKYFAGRTMADSPEVDNQVYVRARYLSPGEFYTVSVVRADDYDLYGILA